MKKNRLTIFQLLTIFTLTFFISGNSSAFTSMVYGDCVRGNDKIKSIERDVPKFDVLDFSGAFIVNIVAGSSKQNITITGDENLLPLIATSSRGNRLAIYPEKSICTENDITIDISMGTLLAVTSSGSDDIKVSGLNNLSFSLVQGGAGNVNLAGHTRKFDAEVSGSGDLEAQHLKTENTTLNLTGSTNANVHASEELTVHITGVADVNYFGNPKKVIKEIIGVGDVNKMD